MAGEHGSWTAARAERRGVAGAVADAVDAGEHVAGHVAVDAGEHVAGVADAADVARGVVVARPGGAGAGTRGIP